MEITTEPPEAFLLLVGEKKISVLDAIRLVEKAEIDPFIDLDRISVRQFRARIVTQGRMFSFTPNNLIHLHRSIYDFDNTLYLPRKTIADLCLRAGCTFQSLLVEFNFRSALAYAVEMDGDRDLAMDTWTNNMTSTLKRWIDGSLESMFIEVRVDEGGWQRDLEKDPNLKILRDFVERGRKTKSRELEYRGLRPLAICTAEFNALRQAMEFYEQTFACGEAFLEPAAKLVLIGDMLWLAIKMRDERYKKDLSNKLTRHGQSVPKLVGCAALFARSALLCKAAGNSEGEIKFSSWINSCLY